jgi:hypothetical protein
LKERVGALSKQNFLYFLVVGALFVGWGLSYGKENKKEVTVFYTHAIDGFLEPCG